MGKSSEQRLIIKEHIAMHTNFIILFKPALYFSTLVIKLFKSSIKYFAWADQRAKVYFIFHKVASVLYGK